MQNQPALLPAPNLPHAVATVGFQGFEAGSLWFPALPSSVDEIGDELFIAAKRSRDLAQAMLQVGCHLASKTRPDLAEPLARLSEARFDMDFFDFQAPAPALGWFRIAAIAPGATAEALEACEGALAKSRAPLLAAQCSGALADFGSGKTDEPTAAFLASALEATRQSTRALAAADPIVASVDVLRLETKDGSGLSCAMASCASDADPLGAIKTMAKIAQACVDARSEAQSKNESDAFFARIESALLGQDGPIASRERVDLPVPSFYPIASGLHATRIDGLPTEGFDAHAQLFLKHLSKRFGVMSASKSIGSDWSSGSALTHAQACALAPLLERMPKPAEAIALPSHSVQSKPSA